MSRPDLNDMHRNGTLPRDPFEGATPMDAMDDVGHVASVGAPIGETEPANDTDDKRPKMADLVISTTLARAKLFSDGGDAYADVRSGSRREAMRIRSRAFRTRAGYTVRQDTARSVGSTAIEEAIIALEGQALYDSPRVQTFIRVAEHDGDIWLDLADEDGRAVRITSKGWSVETTTPVQFVRPAGLAPLPMPVRGACVEELRKFLNVADDDGYVLAVSWLVTALRPGRPFPALNLVGEQGTGKSTASRVLRSLVDPSVAPVRSAPREERDLFIAARNAHVIAYDNLSGIPAWMSDALCRLATGGAFATRTLHSDADETILSAMRPLILNGIDDIATRSDLADRSLLVTLEPIPAGARRDEETFWRAFADATPRILGALLDGAVSALAHLPSTTLENAPRMADYARWATAAERGLGFDAGRVMAAYQGQRVRSVEVALEASPVATAVRELLAEPQRNGTWEGTARALLGDLDRIVGDAKHARGWPKASNALSRELKRSKTFLREAGVDVGNRIEGRGALSRKFIVLRAGGTNDLR